MERVREIPHTMKRRTNSGSRSVSENSMAILSKFSFMAKLIEANDHVVDL